MSLLLSACSSIPLDEDARTVQLYFGLQAPPQECQLKGEVVGSQGTWYDFWFASNTNLTHGALNDLKNAAQSVGANLVHVVPSQDFATSVTFVGQGYLCPAGVLEVLRKRS